MSGVGLSAVIGVASAPLVSLFLAILLRYEAADRLAQLGHAALGVAAVGAILLVALAAGLAVSAAGAAALRIPRVSR